MAIERAIDQDIELNMGFEYQGAIEGHIELAFGRNIEIQEITWAINE